MSLRSLLALLVIGALLSAFAMLFPTFLLIRTQLAVIFPAELVAQASASLSLLMTALSVVTVLGLAIIALVIYAVLTRLVAVPLRKLALSLDAFAERGESMTLNDLPRIPAELRRLGKAFSTIIEKLEVSHKKDVEVSRVKSDFISTAAHQLRTPLTGIRWSLEALEKSDISEEQRALVASATQKSHELVSIVGTLLDISAIESGKYKYTFMPINLEQLAEEVAQDFSPEAQKAKVSLYVERSETVLPAVQGDRERLKWVLNNLIENAIRYTPEQGSVRIRAEVRASRVFIMVRDSGIGIAEKDRNNIFERFYRAPNAIAVQNGGNGLGLYIARTIATDHGGDLSFAANAEGIGTTFTLQLPIA